MDWVLVQRVKLYVGAVRRLLQPENMLAQEKLPVTGMLITGALRKLRQFENMLLKKAILLSLALIYGTFFNEVQVANVLDHDSQLAPSRAKRGAFCKLVQF